jgi:hypothetical protein
MIVCFPSPDLIVNGTRIAWEARTCVFPNRRRQSVDVRRDSPAAFPRYDTFQNAAISDCFTTGKFAGSVVCQLSPCMVVTNRD